MGKWTAQLERQLTLFPGDDEEVRLLLMMMMYWEPH
jgi:hypothetical protein